MSFSRTIYHQTREPDADIRKMLLEALMQLCTTREVREMMRRRKAYPILREHHKWEPESDVQDACEQVVQLLIQEEHELVAGDLRQVDVPEKFVTAIEATKVRVVGSGPTDRHRNGFYSWFTHNFIIFAPRSAHQADLAAEAQEPAQ